MAVASFVGYGRQAYAACTGSSGTYLCTGSNSSTQTINADNASVSTAAGFGVNTSSGNAITITGDGALSFTDTHASTIRVPIFDNDQDMERLALRVDTALDKQQRDNQTRAQPVHCFGFLLRGHGLYAWGADIASAARHVEAFEYLFGCELELARLKR